MARKRKVKLASGLEIEKGSGNVYKDLGFRDAEGMLAKARIVGEIVRIIRSRRLTQTAAAKVLGLSQPKVSALLSGHFQRYSQERLIWLLNRLGCDVEIVVKPTSRSRAVGRVCGGVRILVCYGRIGWP
jgi:predicted XRE-type DNA-binding protein